MTWPKRLNKAKYRSKLIIIDGIKFRSKKEARRYGELKLLLKAGFIIDLVLQPIFKFYVNGNLICKYVADFQYLVVGDDRTTVEDTKGFKTTDYIIKRKLFLAMFPDFRFLES